MSGSPQHPAGSRQRCKRPELETAENAIYYRDKGREESPWGQELRVVPVYRGRNRKSERESVCEREWK